MRKYPGQPGITCTWLLSRGGKRPTENVQAIHLEKVCGSSAIDSDNYGPGQRLPTSRILTLLRPNHMNNNKQIRLVDEMARKMF